MHTPSDIQIFQARAVLFMGPRGPWLEHLVQDEGLSFEDAARALVGWELIPYIDTLHGHMATLIKKNREVHLAVFRRFRGKGHINAARIREFFQPILDKEVFLVTKLAAKDDPRFILHFGFQELGVTIGDDITTYILNNIRYPRKAA